MPFKYYLTAVMSLLLIMSISTHSQGQVKGRGQAVNPNPQAVSPQAVNPNPQTVPPQAVNPNPQAVSPQAVNPNPQNNPKFQPVEPEQIIIENNPEPELTLTDEQISQLNNFSWNFLRLNSGEVICPYGAQIALTMLKEGAGTGSKTEKEISAILGGELSEQEILQYLRISQPKTANNNPSPFEVYNGIWTQKGAEFNPAFMDFCVKTLKENSVCSNSTALQADFAGNPTAATNEINNWFAQNTQKRIPQVFDKMNPATRMVLANAVLFNGQWAYPFDVKNTSEKPFYSDGTEISKVKMMNKTGYYRYYSQWDMEIVEIPYKGNLVMYVILPKDNATMKYFLENMQDKYFSQLLNKMESQRLELNIPRFKCNGRIDLIKTFQSLGADEMFSSRADYSKMTGDKSLTLGTAFQQAVIEVNETGTKAVAATVATVIVKGSGVDYKQDAIVFNANHPFVYLIATKATDVEAQKILFAGKIDFGVSNKNAAEKEAKTTKN